MNTRIIVLVLAFMVMIGLGAAITVDVYDINGDGVIDATERVNMDIDIEHNRLSQSEGCYLTQFTTSDTQVLTPRYEAALCAAPEEPMVVPGRPEREVIEFTIEEPKPVVVVLAATPEPPTLAPTTPYENDNITITVIVGVIGIVMIMLVGVIYSLCKD